MYIRRSEKKKKKRGSGEGEGGGGGGGGRGGGGGSYLRLMDSCITQVKAQHLTRQSCVRRSEKRKKKRGSGGIPEKAFQEGYINEIYCTVSRY